MSLILSLLYLTFHPFSCDQNTALSLCYVINPSLLSQHVQTLQIINLQALFSSLKPPVLRKQPTEQPNFCLQSLHSKYSREGAIKTEWWRLMSYAMKLVRGMLIIVCFWFVCLFSLSHSFSPVYLSMANGVVSSEGCSSLIDIALLSIWYAYRLAGSKCSSVQRQNWHSNLSMRVQITDALSSLPFMRLLYQLLFSQEGVSMATEESLG